MNTMIKAFGRALWMAALAGLAWTAFHPGPAIQGLANATDRLDAMWLRDPLAKADAHAAYLAAQLRRAEERVITLADLEGKAQAGEPTDRPVESIRCELELAKAQRDDLTARTAAAQAMVRELRMPLDGGPDARRLKDELAHRLLQAQVDQASLKAAMARRDELAHQIQQAIAQRQALTQQRDDLADQRENLTRQCDKVAQQRDLAMQELKAAREQAQEVAGVRVQLQQSQASLAQIQAQRDTATVQCDLLSRQLQTARKESASLRQDAALAQAAVRDVQAANAQVVAQVRAKATQALALAEAERANLRKAREALGNRFANIENTTTSVNRSDDGFDPSDRPGTLTGFSQVRSTCSSDSAGPTKVVVEEHVLLVPR